jgi:hypothetical protein
MALLTGTARADDPPANDLCANAILIEDGSLQFSTNDALTDGPGESSCVTFGSQQTWNDIWYRYTAPQDGILIVSTCSTVDYDSRIVIYMGDCDNMVEYACNDDGDNCTGYSSFVLCHCIEGTEYLVRIGGYAEDQTGSGSFGVKAASPCDLVCPEGAQAEVELCGQALNDGCFAFEGEEERGSSFMNEVLTPGVPLCGNWYYDGSYRDTDWFEFEIPEPGGVVNAELYSSDRVVGYVYLAHESCPANIIMYSYGGCPTPLSSPLLAPGTYKIVTAPGFETEIGCEDSQHMDRYVLNVDVSDGGIPVPENDDCADAILVGNGSHVFSTLLSQTDGPPDAPSSCGDFSTAIGADIWFRYTSSCDGEVTVSTCDQADYDTRLEIWEGGCEKGTLIACNDDGDDCAGFTSKLQFQGICGMEYLVRVAGYDSAWGRGTLEISCVGDCDCNSNGIPDSLDILDGTSTDCDTNNIPDECDLESTGSDCNANGILDRCDIASGGFDDEGKDGIPDVCQCELHPLACCPTDLDGDGIIAGADLAMLLGAWGTNDPMFDLDGDGLVSGSDLALILGSWGDC